MFQNITEIEETEEIKETIDSKNLKINIKAILSIPNCVLTAISFLVSMVGFGGELAPFGLAIFAATCSNRAPAIMVYIASLIGTLIGFGKNNLLEYVLTTAVFVVMLLIKRPKMQGHSRNEVQKLGSYVFLSSFIIQIGKLLFNTFLIYDLLTAIMLSVTTYIFYKIFSNSILVIREYTEKKAFTIEEVMGASLLISIAFCAFGEFGAFGLSIRNIFSIMLVMFLGWKNGILVGSTTGITIGVVLGIINNANPILISAYALSRNVGRNIK